MATTTVFPMAEETSARNRAGNDGLIAEDAAERRRRAKLGQFMTPPHVARLMASCILNVPDEIVLLDPGAGTGVLTASFIQELVRRPLRPRIIRVDAFEIDASVQGRLEATLDACKAVCAGAGIAFEHHRRTENFIDAAVECLDSGNLLSAKTSPSYTHVIMNPPYRKLSTRSPDHAKLGAVGIETTNYYAAFMWLALRLLRSDGELVSITPRSFCNGPYFKPFRLAFLKEMSLQRLHLFDSRTAAFNHEGVLQETLILHAVKDAGAPRKVVISHSSGEPDGVIREEVADLRAVVTTHDPEQFIRVAPRRLAAGVAPAETTKAIPLVASLADIGVSVSTGRVVDFRAKDHLRQEPGDDTVPLVYPCHCKGGSVRWPLSGGRKPNAIVHNGATASLLVPSDIYVLVKRFTAKEERRRVVASVYDPDRFATKYVGFENHLNYYHIDGRGLPLAFARGLAAFLNSSILDAQFREFSGHTQVNATDLRMLRYPSREELERLGNEVDDPGLPQEDVDLLLARIIG